MIVKKKRVTIKDLASECNVSTATVSRVLNHIPGNYSAETEYRVLQTASDMGYSPNRMARSLITHKTNLIAVLIPDIHYYFFQDFYAGLNHYLSQRGYRILLCITQEDSKTEHMYISELSNGLVDGMIVCTLNNKEDNRPLWHLASEHFPIVTLERYGEFLEGIYNITINNRHAATCATEYLLKNNHRNIAFIKGHPQAANAELRFEGFMTCMQNHNLPVPPKYIRQADYLFEKSVEVTHELLEQCPEVTAVIAANDLMSMGVVKAAIQVGKRIPEDLSIIGLGNALLTETCEPRLTTVDFQPERLGTIAGEYLLAQIDGQPSQKYDIQLEPTLNLGRSVAKVIHK